MDRRQISFSPPDISELEIAEVAEALRSGWITTGPRTKLLERRLAAYMDTGKNDIDCDTKEAIEEYSNKVVCLNSATVAEELNLRVLGIQPGDEVIVPAYTYTATASAAIHCGAIVKFVDIQKDGDSETHSPEMDYNALESAITEKTKAIVPVDLGGIVCDYNRIFDIIEKKRDIFRPIVSNGTPLSDINAAIQRGIGCVAVISDCAHSLGASRVLGYTGKGKMAPERRYCGRIAHFSSFSFHAVKNITTAEGGASTWCLPEGVYNEGITDAQIYRMYQLLSLHGQNKDALAKTKMGAWEYDIIGPWYKCNMTDVTAAIGLKQLDRYSMLLEKRRALIKKYEENCKDLNIYHLNHYIGDSISSGHLFITRINGFTHEERCDVIRQMAELGIACNVHYKPLPQMTAYKSMVSDVEGYPNADSFYVNEISLPLHTLLMEDDIDYICENLRKVIRR